MCLSPDVSSLCSPSFSLLCRDDWLAYPFLPAMQSIAVLCSFGNAWLVAAHSNPQMEWASSELVNSKKAESGFIACHSFWDFMGAFVNTPCLKKTGHEGITAFCDCPLPRPPERHIHLWLQVCCVCIVNRDLWIDSELVNPLPCFWSKFRFLVYILP